MIILVCMESHWEVCNLGFDGKLYVNWLKNRCHVRLFVNLNSKNSKIEFELKFNRTTVLYLKNDIRNDMLLF